MRKLLAAYLVWMPLAAFGSTVYTFSENLPYRGTVGFTYTAPDYLTQPMTHVSVWFLTGCDTSGLPGWTCTDAYLKQTDINGLPDVQVTLNLVYVADPRDAFSTDDLYDTFPGVTLTADGTYTGFLNGATLTIHDPPDQDAAVPEPANWGMLALAGAVLIGIRLRGSREALAGRFVARKGDAYARRNRW